MAVNCDPVELAKAAACFCFETNQHDATQDAVQALLLCVWAGGAPPPPESGIELGDPNTGMVLGDPNAGIIFGIP